MTAATTRHRMARHGRESPTDTDRRASSRSGTRNASPTQLIPDAAAPAADAGTTTRAGGIGICDPYPAICALIAEVATGLGRLVIDCSEANSAGPLDALVIEPAAPEAVARARELRRAQPDLPLIFVSQRTTHPAAAELEPAVYLVKPFTLAEIEAALLHVERDTAPD